MGNTLELTGQSFKSLRKHYDISYEDFNTAIAPIRKELNKMTTKKRYQNLLPKQVKLIIDFLG